MLRRMVVDGHCTTYLQESTEGPPRKYYKLTPEGKAYMNVLVSEWRNFVDGVTSLLDEAEAHELSDDEEIDEDRGETDE